MRNLDDFYRLFPNRPARRGEFLPSPQLLAAAAVDVVPANEPLIPRPDRYRRRDFGIGYGRSSGYVANPVYATGGGYRLARVG